MMKRFSAFGLAIGLVGCTVIFSDEPSFFGRLEFTDPDCSQFGRCILKENFAYRDPFGVSWQAPAGVQTDGASIPQFLWDDVGRPFDDELVQAAVIHDFYCDNRVRPWQQTHRVFYDALITTGVSKERADILYAGVLLGGPRWNLDGQKIDYGFNPDEAILEQPAAIESPLDVPIVETDENVEELAGTPSDMGEGEEIGEEEALKEMEVVQVNDDEFIEDDEFSDREQETQDDVTQIEMDFAALVEIIEENPDLPPEAIANMAAQIEP